jgi:hypothetical protein
MPTTVGQLFELAAEGHLNQLTEMSVLPEAPVVTGGTSCAPVSIVGF